MTTDTSLTIREPGALAQLGGDSPADIIQAATERAKAAASVIRDRHLFVKVGDRDYVQVEGWTTLGALYGLVGRASSRALDGGGWEAKAEIVNVRTNAIISTAEAECGTVGDEKWIGRPSFQQRSMAQTRALSKAFRLALSWVMVLAGYEATPAEEMDGVRPGKAAPAKPRGGADRQAPPTAPADRPSRNKLFAIMKKHEADGRFMGLMAAALGINVENANAANLGRAIYNNPLTAGQVADLVASAEDYARAQVAGSPESTVEYEPPEDEGLVEG